MDNQIRSSFMMHLPVISPDHEESINLVPQIAVGKKLRSFLKVNGFSVRLNPHQQTYTLNHDTIAGYVISGMTSADVIDFAINHCYPGFDPTPTKALPSAPKVVEAINSTILAPQVLGTFSSDSVSIHNCKYQDVWVPAGTLTITDPPYGIGYGYDKHNDKMTDEEWLDLMKDVPKPCVIIVPHEKVWALVRDPNWGIPDDFVTWIYNGGYRGHQQRMILWYGCKPDMTRPEVGQPFKDPNSRWTKKAQAKGRTLARRYFWWHVEQIMSKNKEKTQHPCQIPEEVMRLIIQSTAMPEQTIFDPFMGSGTTGVVARRFGFPFIGTDISTDYCDIAYRRIMPAVPQVAMPVNILPLVLKAA